MNIFWWLTILSVSLSANEKTLFDINERSSVLEWVLVNDNVMGGRSFGRFEIGDESLRFTGSTNTNGGGFSSIRAPLNDPSLGGFEKIRLVLRGDGREYTIVLRERRSRVSFWATFVTEDDRWQEVVIPFNDFWPNWRGRRLDYRSIDPSAIREIGVMIYDGQDGPFVLELKKLELIQ